MKRKIPFYSNTPDDTHCFQAAIKSVLKYFLPEKEFSFKKLEKMSAKKEGLWTWATAMMINLHKMGFDLVDIDTFNIQKFIKNGGEYLIEKYGKEVGNAQIEHSDINQEKRLFRKYLPLHIHKTTLPSVSDIKKLVDHGYLVVCLVNSYALNAEKRYAGHFVVIFDYDANNLYMHDPGLPPRPNRKVNFKQFLKAWEYPDKKARNLTAYKLPNSA